MFNCQQPLRRCPSAIGREHSSEGTRCRRREGGEIRLADGDPLTLDKAEKLLGVAARAKCLFGPILGWLLTRADEIEWPT